MTHADTHAHAGYPPLPPGIGTRADITPHTLHHVADLVLVTTRRSGHEATLRVDFPTLMPNLRCGHSQEIRVDATGHMSTWFGVHRHPLDGVPEGRTGGVEVVVLREEPRWSPAEILGVRNRHSLAREIAMHAAGLALANAPGADVGPTSAALEAVLGRRISAAWRSDVEPLLPRRAREALAAVGAATSWRYEVYDRLRLAGDAAFARATAFLARHPLLGTSVLVAPDGWDALSAGAPDDEALSAAARWAAVAAVAPRKGHDNYLDPSAKWIAGSDPAHFRAAAGIDDYADNQRVRRQLGTLFALPPEWMPRHGDVDVARRVLETYARSHAHVPFDLPARRAMRIHGGDWRGYAARLASALAVGVEAFVPPGATPADELDRHPHLLDGVLCHVQRDLAGPLALLHPGAAPALHSAVTALLALPRQWHHPTIASAFLAGMDLPSRAAMHARHRMALPGIVGAVSRHAASGTIDQADVPVDGGTDGLGGDGWAVRRVNRPDFMLVPPGRHGEAPGWTQRPWHAGSWIVRVPASTFEGSVLVWVATERAWSGDLTGAMAAALRVGRPEVGDALLSRLGVAEAFRVQASPATLAARGTFSGSPPEQPSYAVSEASVSEVLGAWLHVLPRRLRVADTLGAARAFEAAFVVASRPAAT